LTGHGGAPTFPAMSQKRDELVQIRQDQFTLVNEQRKLGDFDAGASFARRQSEIILKIVEHILERTR
jgi:hypothetical protein